jgi:hypothetical protein
MFKTKISIIFIIFLFFYSCKQNIKTPYIEWQKNYGGKFDDWNCGIVQSSDSGFFVGYTTNSVDSNSYSLEILKADKQGKNQWQKNFNIHKNLITKVLKKYDNNSLIAAGWYNSLSNNRINSWIVKIDKKGRLIWQKDLGTSHSNIIASIQKSSNNSILALLTTNSKGAGGYDIWLVKINKNGTIEWDKTYGSILDEQACSLCQTADSSIYILGNKLGENNKQDLWLIKTDKNGNKIWDKILGSKSLERSCCIFATKDNSIIIAANIIYNNDSSKACFLKLNAQGNIKWNFVWDNQTKQEVQAANECNDNSYIFAGNSEGKKSNIFVLKLSKNGKLLWSKTINDIQNIKAKTIIQTLDNGYAIGGDIENPKYKKNCLLIKLSPDK